MNIKDFIPKDVIPQTQNNPNVGTDIVKDGIIFALLGMGVKKVVDKIEDEFDL
jgi:hypothetical protein